ncbi:MAG: primase alpha helix C-terminal domain-containing protein, partial [Thermoleophilia bacterium]
MPPEGALGEMPDALIHAFLERRPRTAADTEGDPIPEGGRNAALTSLAGTMRRRGMTAAAIAAALHAENTERCNPPLPEEEVDTIARSVASYPAAEAPKAASSAAGFVFASNV